MNIDIMSKEELEFIAAAFDAVFKQEQVAGEVTIAVRRSNEEYPRTALSVTLGEQLAETIGNTERTAADLARAFKICEQQPRRYHALQEQETQPAKVEAGNGYANLLMPGGENGIVVVSASVSRNGYPSNGTSIIATLVVAMMFHYFDDKDIGTGLKNISFDLRGVNYEVLRQAIATLGMRMSAFFQSDCQEMQAWRAWEYQRTRRSFFLEAS